MRSLYEFLGDVLRGPRCPVCSERTKWMRVHLRIDHADDGRSA